MVEQMNRLKMKCAYVMILMALLGASCATDPFQFGQRQLAEEQATACAFAWLVDQQRPDGFWGTHENRVALTSLATLAFLSHGETITSEQYGKPVENAIRALVREANRQVDRSPTDQALLTWCLAETYGMTRIPALASFLPALAEQLDTPAPTPWHPSAAHAVLMGGAETNHSRRTLLELEAIFSSRTNHMADQVVRLFLKRRMQGQANSSAYLAALRDVRTNDWRQSEAPLQTAWLLSQELFVAGGPDWKAWESEFFPWLVQRQTVRGQQGWWTPARLGLRDTPETVELSADDSRVYATSLMLMTLARPRKLPSYSPPAVPPQPDSGENQKSRIEIL